MEGISYQYTFYIWPYIATVSMNLFMILYVFKNRHNPGAAAFCVTLLFSSLWCVGSAMENSAVTLEAKLFWIKVGYLAYALSPLSWTIMVLQISDRRAWTTWHRIALLSAVPITTVLVVWTNDWHGWAWQQMTMKLDGTLVQKRGWWFFVHAVYSDGLNLASVLLTIRFWQNKAPYYGKQLKSLAFSMLFVMVVNGLYVLRIGPPIDTTPIAWGLSSLFITWSLFRNKLFDLVPIARNRVLESMADGIVVLDQKNRIVDMNPSAQGVFQCETASVLGCDAFVFWEKWPDIQRLLVMRDSHVELQYRQQQEPRYYAVVCSALKNEQELIQGRIVTIRDITEKKLAEQELLQKQQEIAVKEERERMARDLHDNLGQIMGFINVQGQAIHNYLEQAQREKAEYCLERLTEVAREAHNAVRETILSMRGEVREKSVCDFFQEIQRQAELLQQCFGIVVKVDVVQAHGLVPKHSEDANQVLNILKESMNNIIKHAQASVMKVVAEETAGGLQLSVIDNGRGFTQNKAELANRGNHYGLLFMQERAAELGGTVHIQSKPGQGTVVTISLPKSLLREIG